jgi:ubiquinone/menaquinone biosynthesis C-methylase UbiE
MLSFAEGHSADQDNIRFEQMDASCTRFPDAYFSAAASMQSAHHWTNVEGILAEVHRVLKPGASFYIFEADRHLKHVPEGWVLREGFWPPDGLVRLGWRRFGMDADEWSTLRQQAQSSPFSAVQDDRQGFYRRMVLTR